MHYYSKRIVVSICCILLASVSAFAQEVEQQTVQVDGKLYIQSNDNLWEVCPDVVTVKPKRGIDGHRFTKDTRFYNKLGYVALNVPSDMSVEEYVEELKQSEEFETVEFNSYAQKCFIPNEYQYQNQPYLSKTNVIHGWNFTTGDSCIKVAVIDSGVDAGHSDLGYGFDSYSNVNTALGYDYINETTYSTPTDGHGTNTAGIIGAKTNNSYGICGISGGNNCSGTKILSYCVGSGSNFTNVYIGSAIIAAVEQGAKVINISLVSSETSEINAAINYAFANNVSIVCASGNDNVSTVYYPASSDKTIAVGSLGASDSRAYFSNYGQGLDLVAPGENICTTSLNNTYDLATGTSVSAPLVTGTIALMLSIDPTLTPTKIRNILRNSCKKLTGYTYTSGWNEEVGYGMLDVEAALASLMNISGSAVLCDSSSLSIPGLPSTYSIAWHIAGTHSYLDSIIHVDNLPYNECCIINPDYVLDDTITATISRSGRPDMLTLRKPVCANLSDNVWYSQTPRANNKYNYPTIPETYLDPAVSDCIVINPECTITIRCLRFKYMNLSATGVGSLNRIDDETISFVAPRPNIGSNPAGFTISATSDNHCNDFTIHGLVQRNNVLLVPSFNCKYDGNGITIEYLETDPAEKSLLSLSIENVFTGKVYFSNERYSSPLLVPTSGWPSGIYLIRASRGRESFFKKFAVK